MNSPESLGDCSEFVEVDPTGRYGRYDEILGKGASKTVYKAFDEYEGIEVAWNQVKLYDFLQSPEDLERLYCEIHLLKTLKHENIMKFYTSWVDTTNRNINFVTEMFTSGTLRQYRLKHRRVNIRGVKHWCRQILKGLLYLHSLDPPVIHRDLKCDNIFINGNQGEVKIGDLGLAAILKKSHAVRVVGTPEFMAPEVYEEEYNELVDIYSFGMCVLEMVTFEYPYSECSHPAHIYKKVISGRKPNALYRVNDPEVREFVEKCLATVSSRLSARELLNDPFLQSDDYASDHGLLDYEDFNGAGPIVRQPFYRIDESNGSLNNDFTNYHGYYPESLVHPVEIETSELDLVLFQDDEHSDDVDIAIKGRMREDDGIFLRLRIADKEGRIRNIYFPFDIETDTALSVATEMVAELDITNQDVVKIADMIDGEIAALVPEWKTTTVQEEILQSASAILCQNCGSNGYLLDHVSSNGQSTKNVQVLQCSKDGCASVHGRFEEITYQVEGPEQCDSTDCKPITTGQANRKSYTDIWAQRNMPEVSSQESRVIHCDEGQEETNGSVHENEGKILNTDSHCVSNAKNSIPSNPSAVSAHWDDYENEIRQELRWLKAKYQMQIRELKDQQLGVKPKPMSVNANLDTNGVYTKNNSGRLPSLLPKVKKEKNGAAVKPGLPMRKHIRCLSTDAEERCLEQIFSATSFYNETPFLPHSLHRASSLPVDAVDV